MSSPALNQEGSEGMSEHEAVWKKIDKLQDADADHVRQIERQNGRLDVFGEKMEYVTQRIERIHVDQQNNSEKILSALGGYGEKVDLLMESHHKNTGKSEGMSSVWKWIAGAAGLIATALAILAFFK